MKSVDASDASPPEFAKYSATTAASAAAPTVAKSVVEARPPRIEKYRVLAESELAVSSVESGSVGPGASDTVSVAATVVAKSVLDL